MSYARSDWYRTPVTNPSGKRITGDRETMSTEIAVSRYNGVELSKKGINSFG